MHRAVLLLVALLAGLWQPGITAGAPQLADSPVLAQVPPTLDERRGINVTSTAALQKAMQAAGVGHCFVQLHGIPKSGTTWLEVIMDTLGDFWCNRSTSCRAVDLDIARNKCFVHAEASSHSRCKPLRVWSFAPKHVIVPGVDLRTSTFRGTLSRSGYCESLVHKRTANDTALAECVADIQAAAGVDTQAFSRQKTIAIMRDPRSTATSFCHYTRQAMTTCHQLNPLYFAEDVTVLNFAYRFWKAQVSVHPIYVSVLLMDRRWSSIVTYLGLLRMRDSKTITHRRTGSCSFISRT